MLYTVRFNIIQKFFRKLAVFFLKAMHLNLDKYACEDAISHGGLFVFNSLQLNFNVALKEKEAEKRKMLRGSEPDQWFTLFNVKPVQTPSGSAVLNRVNPLQAFKREHGLPLVCKIQAFHLMSLSHLEVVPQLSSGHPKPWDAQYACNLSNRAAAPSVKALMKWLLLFYATVSEWPLQEKTQQTHMWVFHLSKVVHGQEFLFIAMKTFRPFAVISYHILSPISQAPYRLRKMINVSFGLPSILQGRGQRGWSTLFQCLWASWRPSVHCHRGQRSPSGGKLIARLKDVWVINKQNDQMCRLQS